MTVITFLLGNLLAGACFYVGAYWAAKAVLRAQRFVRAWRAQ